MTIEPFHSSQTNIVRGTSFPEGTPPRGISFSYTEPREPITRPGFIGAFWGEVDPNTHPHELTIRGQISTVGVFGFQSLAGAGAKIEMHPEMKLSELTYPIQGDMDMIIETQNEHPVVSHMRGQIPPTVDLNGSIFTIDEDGVLHIMMQDEYFTVYPTVTPQGSSHATEVLPASGAPVYLAVKVLSIKSELIP